MLGDRLCPTGHKGQSASFELGDDHTCVHTSRPPRTLLRLRSGPETGDPEKEERLLTCPIRRIFIFCQTLENRWHFHGQQESSFLFPWVLLKHSMLVAFVATMARHRTFHTRTSVDTLASSRSVATCSVCTEVHVSKMSYEEVQLPRPSPTPSSADPWSKVGVLLHHSPQVLRDARPPNVAASAPPHLAAEYGRLVSGFQPITLANQNDLARVLYPVPTQVQRCSFHLSTRQERCCPLGGYRRSSSEGCNRACPSG